MTGLIELATGNPNDPILMDWAISRYWQMEKRHPQHREAMEQSWFDDLTLRRWLRCVLWIIEDILQNNSEKVI